MDNVDYVIIQAGGLGSRLKHLTINKPKAIVSVNNLPIIFHLFRKYPDKHYIIIGDYKKDVLDKYLATFADVSYLTVGTGGKKGTCSGISNALSLIPPKKRFMLIWSDLILGKKFQIPNDDNNYIGISGTFPCRWSFKDDIFIEEKSCKNGVAGLFILNDVDTIRHVPNEGEFVRWLQTTKIKFNRLLLAETAEYGVLDNIKCIKSGKCRPFNSMTIEKGRIIKTGIDEQGKKLAEREKNWYKYVIPLKVPIPTIYSFEPFTMELIDGRNVFEYDYLSDDKKETILESIMSGLKSIHSHDHIFVDRFSMHKAYFTKTIDRLSKIRNLVPFADEPFVLINGKKCRNIFFHMEEVLERISIISCDHFNLIHGDCTFSNIMLRKGEEPVFIDPRGYFGDCELVGDPNYDWSKLYYSVVGNYDQFNLGRFSLEINEESVNLKINSNGWENTEKTFIKNLPDYIKIEDVRFIHALIWLSLTTYAWDDYDSICGSFYNGLLYLEESL